MNPKKRSPKKHGFHSNRDAHEHHHAMHTEGMYFVAPNPVTSQNTESIAPHIHETALIGPFASIIGDITLRENVFVAPHVSIRADEGTPVYIDADTNLQDGAILHGLAHGRVSHEDHEYSIYIGKRVSCAHGCIIHGPCKIEDDVFVGFYAVVLNAQVGKGSFIGHQALITGGVTIPPMRIVPMGAIIETQEQADALAEISDDKIAFAKEVVEVNCEFPRSYSCMFGHDMID